MLTPTQTATVAIALIQDSYDGRYDEMGQRVATLSYEEMGHVLTIVTSYATSAVQSMCGDIVDPTVVLDALATAVMDTARQEEAGVL